VATVVRRAVEWGLTHRRWKPLHVIGIDEVSRAKGQRYLTLVYDLARGQLVWVGENRDARFLWLKNPWNLKDPERARLSAICQTNQPIVRASYLKEAFQLFWTYRSAWWAQRHLTWWLRWAARSRLERFVTFARMIRGHLDGILAWTTVRLSNGALEGMNNKVRIVSHRAYGFRKTETYITAIWHGCGALPLPPS